MTSKTLPDWLVPVNETPIDTYARLGWKLIPVPAGTKGPRTPGWNKRENCYLSGNWQGNVGLALAYSGVVSIDIDNRQEAARWLADRGIDLDVLYQAPGAVRIDSGKACRGKLLYKLPEGSQPLVSEKITIDRECILEFRCGTASGLTVQDLIFPSIHPETQQPYQWVRPGHVDLFDWLNAMPTLPDDLLRVWQDRTAPREPVITNPDLSADWDQVQEALNCIPPDCSRDEWIRVGMGLHDAGVKSGSPDTGFYLWDQWSQGSAEKYPGQHDLIGQWKSFKAGDGVSIGTLLRLASENGWTRPPVDPADLFAGVLCTDDQTDGHPELSHDALARELSTAAGFTQNARYLPQWGSWVFWRNNRWEVDQKLYHMTAVREFLQRKAKGLVNWANNKAATLPDKDANRIVSWAQSNAKALRQAGNVNSVETLARSNADLVAGVEQFDADLMLLGTPGGTVDLRTGELLTAERDHWITKHTAISPAPAGMPAPLWSAFLNRIFDNDPELIAFMQRAAGYALTGHTTEHKLIFAYGTGSNGKSVFINTLFNLMKDYARRAPAQTFLDSTSDRHPTDLAGLHGARLVVGSELPAGKAWNESVVKDLTGGDVITARKMRQDFFEYTPQFTLFIAGNHQPSFQGIDEAIRRRVVLVPFTQTIPEAERDPALPEKLKAEWPAILRWMIDGALAWQSQGLAVPQSVKAASDEYLDFEDTLGEFIAEHLRREVGETATTAAIFDRFTMWQRQNGIGKTWTKKGMTQALRERGFNTAKLTGGTRGFRDVALVQFKPPNGAVFSPRGDV